MTTIDEFLEEKGLVKPPVQTKKLTIGGFLAHYGIPGMKWGIRRERGPAGTVSSNPAVKTSTDTSPRKLSDQDLQAAVQRMRLEREFRQLRDSERPTKGESFTKNMLKEIGKKQVRRVANTAADIAIEQAIAQLGVKSKNPHVSEVATRMKPKKKK
jgi:hypothetical protein